MHFDLNLLVESDLNEVCGKWSKLKFAIVESDLNLSCGTWSNFSGNGECAQKGICGLWSKDILPLWKLI